MGITYMHNINQYIVHDYSSIVVFHNPSNA